MSGTGPKPKRNRFSAALDAACKRYGQATKEREQAVRKLDALNQELPALQETIAALQKQLNPGKATMTDVDTHRTHVVGPEIPTLPLTSNHTLIGIPDEVAKHLVLDLSGMGSVPAPQTTEEPKSADTAPDTK
jgi:hypothetical protein